VTDNATTPSTPHPRSSRPSVLFVCVHNAGRSQMAAGFLTVLAGDAVEVRSAGSVPADAVNPAAVQAMNEVGIDIADQRPKILTTDTVEASDVVITMGCGDACPIFPGKTYLDWQLDDRRRRRRGRAAHPRRDPPPRPGTARPAPRRPRTREVRLPVAIGRAK